MREMLGKESIQEKSLKQLKGILVNNEKTNFRSIRS